MECFQDEQQSYFKEGSVRLPHTSPRNIILKASIGGSVRQTKVVPEILVPPNELQNHDSTQISLPVRV